MDPQWVSAAANIVVALGVIGVVMQVGLAIRSLEVTANQLDTSVKALKADHERSRREKAIELLSYWDSNSSQKGSMARKFTETLTFQQAKCLWNQEAFEANGRHFSLFLGAISIESARLRNEDSKNDKIAVSEREAGEIRWAVVTYLNQLETTLAAVRHEVADKEMIYEQFIYLVSPKDGHYVLEDFRKAAGGAEFFPSIESFANELKQRHQVKSNGKVRIA